MKKGIDRFEGELWRVEGPGGWRFITLPEDLSDIIRFRTVGAASAWGSLKVTATIGATRWSTSLFPDTRRKAYLLPVKADVRKREKLAEGAVVAVTLWLG
ncbi:MAG: DUF1905 domain-containing protein [Nitrospinae bacterium]|nr:DUF1905 domain-containing protein [Nitrospinota bacterium]